MKIFTVCFFGHRQVDDYKNVDQSVYDIVCRLIKEKEYVDFFVGREGDFDQIVSSAVIRAKKNIFDGNSSLIWVQPYLKADYRDYPEDYESYYDFVEICSESEIVHPKAAIQTRNRNMIDRSDLCVFYVSKEHGGAWQTLQFAKQQKKEIINITQETKQDAGIDIVYG